VGSWRKEQAEQILRRIFFQELIFGKRAKMVDGTLGSFVVREEEREMT